MHSFLQHLTRLLLPHGLLAQSASALLLVSLLVALVILGADGLPCVLVDAVGAWICSRHYHIPYRHVWRLANARHRHTLSIRLICIMTGIAWFAILVSLVFLSWCRSHMHDYFLGIVGPLGILAVVFASRLLQDTFAENKVPFRARLCTRRAVHLYREFINLFSS